MLNTNGAAGDRIHGERQPNVSHFNNRAGGRHYLSTGRLPHAQCHHQKTPCTGITENMCSPKIYLRKGTTVGEIVVKVRPVEEPWKQRVRGKRHLYSGPTGRIHGWRATDPALRCAPSSMHHGQTPSFSVTSYPNSLRIWKSTGVYATFQSLQRIDSRHPRLQWQTTSRAM